VGRFIGEDPVGFGSEDFNVYRYVANNSLNWVDPDGLKLSKAACDALRSLIESRFGDLLSDLRRYSPDLDARGGYPIYDKKTGKVIGKTKPGGHYQEIRERQGGLKNNISRYVNECRKDNDDDNPPLRRCIDQAANRPIPKPILKPGNPFKGSDIGKGAAIGVGAVGTGYIIYRGVRLIPSLLPPLWPTLAPNLAVP
jgi:uncharacterized protein RhaS with RHS repeats